MTSSQAKKKCQRLPIARSCSAGSVAQDGNPRSSISPSGPREAPRNPVVSNAWPKMVVTPPTGSPLSSSLAENERKGCWNWVASPQLSAGRALKICIPLISSMSKQSALTQWQTRTSAECRTTTRGTATGCAEDAEGMDAMAIAFRKGKRSSLLRDARGESFALGAREARIDDFFRAVKLRLARGFQPDCRTPDMEHDLTGRRWFPGEPEDHRG